MKLEVGKPQDTCDIQIGVFQYTEDGKPVTADFYVRTCEDREQQAEDYNEQFTEEWTILMNSGVKNLEYKELPHNPIF